MTTPRDQVEFVVKYKNRTRPEFVNAFSEKFRSVLTPDQMMKRVRSLWDLRYGHAIMLEATRKKEQEAQHVVMVPARIVTKHVTPSSDSLPDVGELLVRTNNLLAELVQLQKEQITFFREIKEVKK